jgi:hypothetical protein
MIKLLKRTFTRLFRRKKPRVERGLAALTPEERRRLFHLIEWEKLAWSSGEGA